MAKVGVGGHILKSLHRMTIDLCQRKNARPNAP